MMAALVWKEYREHRVVWLAMACVSALTLLAVDRFDAAPTAVERGVLLLVIAAALAWVYGLVCGGMLLAGEREDRTLAFLDALPRLRREMWAAKGLIGSILVLTQAAFLTVVVAGLAPAGRSASGWVVMAAAAIGLGWSLWFSADADSVLQAIGRSIGAQILTTFPLAVLGVLLSYEVVHHLLWRVLIVVLTAAWALGGTLLGFVRSAQVFCRTEPAGEGPPGSQLPEAALSQSRQHTGPTGSWTVLVWLCWRQTRLFAVALFLFSAVLSMLVLGAGAGGWVLASVVLGVACGVTAFADEQSSGACQFLGDQRFPPGRVWLVKTAVRLALACLAAIVILLPDYLIGRAELPPVGRSDPLLAILFPNDLLSELAPAGAFLTLWLLHGFSAGVLCGMLFRKTLVSAVLGLGLAMAAASIWLPSLLGGGLEVWQIAGIPVLFLAVSRLLYPAWAGRSLAGRRTALRLVLTASLSIVWVVGTLVWRVAEVPDVPEQLDLAAFTLRLQTLDASDASRLTANACEGIFTRAAELAGRPGPTGRGLERRSDVRNLSRWKELANVLTRGWPADDPKELAPWLDRMSDNLWRQQLAEAAPLPPGLLVDPRRWTVRPPTTPLDGARCAALVLASHGLALQARGNSRVFLGDLRDGLALARTVRSGSGYWATAYAREVEGYLLAGLGLWLERTADQPELVREALELLKQHEAKLPDVSDVILGDYLAAQRALARPEELIHGRVDRDPLEPLADPSQIAAVGLAWQVPWERARLERYLRRKFAAERPELLQDEGIAPPVRSLEVIASSKVAAERCRDLARLRDAELRLALALYKTQKWKLPEALESLVSSWLTAVPAGK
jgi:hypothetical protein